MSAGIINALHLNKPATGPTSAPVLTPTQAGLDPVAAPNLPMLASTNYIPPPTNAMLYMGGFTAQPANPLFFCSTAEAQSVMRELLADNIIPGKAKLVDHPEELGMVIYGADGRRVWCIDFDSVSQPIGMLIAMEHMYPSSPWKVVGSGIVKNPTNF